MSLREESPFHEKENIAMRKLPYRIGHQTKCHEPSSMIGRDIVPHMFSESSQMYQRSPHLWEWCLWRPREPG